MMKVYLAGPVRKMEDSGKAWRDEVIDEFGGTVEILNPLDKYDFRNKDMEVVYDAEEVTDQKIHYKDIVKNDLQMIDSADVVFVGHHDVQMIGTPMEIMYCGHEGIPVVTYDFDGVGMESMSPWMVCYSDEVIEDSLQKAVQKTLVIA